MSHRHPPTHAPREIICSKSQYTPLLQGACALDPACLPSHCSKRCTVCCIDRNVKQMRMKKLGDSDLLVSEVRTRLLYLFGLPMGRLPIHSISSPLLPNFPERFAGAESSLAVLQSLGRGVTPPLAQVCLGTMTWGKQNSEEEAMKQLDVAFDKYGVNFIDTAGLCRTVPVAARLEHGRRGLWPLQMACASLVYFPLRGEKSMA